MNIKTGVEVAGESWCDVNLESFTWGSGGRDVILTFLMHENQVGVLTCTWAHSIKFNLTSRINEGGLPLSWNAKIEENDVNGWALLFDFSDRGVVELICNEISLELRVRT
ncbi:hypothetical protein [Teredinibacter purpureus]|uniref:hypothetical protein n=1 Tax=Teredinibacter purpureus TaxID=2731756 RepID=UPI0005F76A30|nr:hypothetical protein [Teredinibacter purpureus]